MAGYRGVRTVADWLPAALPQESYRRSHERLTRAGAAATPEQVAAARTYALRQAAVDTGALELLYSTDRGFTRSVAVVAAALEVAVERVKGPHVAALIGDQMRAYEHLLDAATGNRPLTMHLVREVHALTVAHQPTYDVLTSLSMQQRSLVPAAYKTTSNNPTRPDGAVHPYAPPDDVAVEMTRLLDEHAEALRTGLHPVLRSAYLHHGFVVVHPFPDGNGRVARQLGSIDLYQDAGIPLIVYADQRDRYLDALEAADLGDTGPWCRFVLDRAVDAMETAALRLEVAGLGEAQSAADALTRLLSAADPVVRLADAVQRVEDALDAELARQIGELRLPADVDLDIHRTPEMHSMRAPEEFRLSPAQATTLRLRLCVGGVHRVGSIAESFVSEAGAERPVVLLAGSGFPTRTELPVDQVLPELSTAAAERLRLFAEALLSTTLREAAAG